MEIPRRAEAPGEEDVARASCAFARGLPARVAHIVAARDAGDLHEARRLTRKLRSAAACYGMMTVEQAAAALESELFDTSDAASYLLAYVAEVADREARRADETSDG